ncbi:type II toxin-antitoxin system VapC family toxin [Alicyclobacillus fodiniaquatilis]|uniref:Type II toxin-antitoxin system VapC family toxin n=1 Tax=Alicyclobacillus fodiniaquatilis TaxID=1661150 RepID=A0ABW4JR35_9BACL
MRWIDTCDEKALFLSVITFGELQKGIWKPSDSNRAERLQKWVNQELTKRFEGRILSIDLDVSFTWGKLQSTSEKEGVKLPVMDSLIAATAMAHHLIVVTRNVRYLERCQVTVYNPGISLMFHSRPKRQSRKIV